MATREHIPSHLLDDLQMPDAELYIAPNWKIKTSPNRLWLYNEKAGSLDFVLHEATAKIIIRISSQTTAVKDVKDIEANSWLKILLDLWAADIIRVNDGDRISTIKKESVFLSSRYVWMEEYLSRYASQSLPVSRMLMALSSSKICIIGLGGLGSTLALTLAASGVGSLKLIDGDVIEESNLPRQILYSEASIGKKKVEVLRGVISGNNSATEIEMSGSYISSTGDASDAIEGCNFAVLCADQPRFEIRNWVGKACLERKIPHIFMAGQWVGPLVVPDASPCYACIGRFHGSRVSDASGYIESLSSTDPPIRDSFGPRPLLLAGFMSSTILHFLTGIDRETPLHRRFRFDLFGRIEEERLVRYKNCIICGAK